MSLYLNRFLGFWIICMGLDWAKLLTNYAKLLTRQNINQIYTLDSLEAVSIWGFVLGGLIVALFLIFFFITFCQVGR